ncbi:MAG: hypothetical protein EON91_10560 [Brevundimonas sp.]|uniref:hypothetical protein n=1 Tax=Brevundimonas sp. TaxID=1871086 RepID=UPI001201D861|nr:hypothetical protein [Brevundimonas sp.]RZJ17111.1 MAG: hypothetical protein EON91_10560 [Brevundimonas sp.]
MSDLTRDQLVGRARAIPRDIFGAASIAGFLLSIFGLVLLTNGVPGLSGPFRSDWRLALILMVVGVALMMWAGGVIQRRFLKEANAAGFSPAQVREIEDEAERLNEKED